MASNQGRRKQERKFGLSHDKSVQRMCSKSYSCKNYDFESWEKLGRGVGFSLPVGQRSGLREYQV